MSNHQNEVIAEAKQEFTDEQKEIYIRTCNECNDIQDDAKDLNQDMCESCYEYNYCECGNRLEDSYGEPGQGLCRACD